MWISNLIKYKHNGIFRYISQNLIKEHICQRLAVQQHILMYGITRQQTILLVT